MTHACVSRETIRICETCRIERPLVLFPKLQKRGRSKRCQLCRDKGVVARRPKDVLKLRSASLKADRSRKKLRAARVETVGGERETV